MDPLAPVTATTILCMMGRYLLITNDKNTMERWNGVFLLKLLIVGGLVIVFSSSGRRVPAGSTVGLGVAKAGNNVWWTKVETRGVRRKGRETAMNSIFIQRVLTVEA